MTQPRTPRTHSRTAAPRTAPRSAQATTPFERPRKTAPAPAAESSRPAPRKIAKAAAPAGFPPAAPRKPAFPAPQPEPMKFGARISRRASERLRAGHLWVYSTEIEALGLPKKGETPALLPVADNRGLLLGTALYSPTSQIALRMIAREEIGEAQWLQLLAVRLRAAIARRQPMLAASAGNTTDALRLCFSEADDIPGLIVDKYAGLVIVQILAKGLDSTAVRAVCVQVLREELSPAAIVERPDPRIRELEGLSAPNLDPLFLADPAAPASATAFQINGLRFHFDANSGQKTGAFLDQRLNYAAAHDWAVRLGTTGRALDVCTYQGGFALHLAQVCREVTGIDSSRASLEVAEKNEEANRALLQAKVDWVEADAFEILRGWSDAREKFDTIVLDPPAFAKTQRAVEGALRGYKELNLRALRMLTPGGLLLTCSCSQHVSWTDLEATVAAAALDAGRRVRLLERRGAASDHPVVLNLPETEYLKCLVLQADQEQGLGNRE